MDGRKKNGAGPGDDIERCASAVIDAAAEVHRQLGPGYKESLYEEALCIELAERGIPFRRQVHFCVGYKGRPIGEGRVDLVVADCLLVELKAVDDFADVHTSQCITYLKAMSLRLALLINFKVQFFMNGVKRVIL